MRKGFTLIEMLIVIVVIGVLIAMMMFSSTEAESSARVQNIINNLNQIAKAVNSWYFDNLDRIVKNNEGHQQITDTNRKNPMAFKVFAQKYSEEITKYLNNGKYIKLTGKEDTTIKAGDYILIDCDYKFWYICYDTGSDTRLQSKLAGKAVSTGLFRLGSNSNSIKDNVNTNSNYTGGRYVAMFVLDLDKK